MLDLQEYIYKKQKHMGLRHLGSTLHWAEVKKIMQIPLLDPTCQSLIYRAAPDRIDVVEGFG